MVSPSRTTAVPPVRIGIRQRRAYTAVAFAGVRITASIELRMCVGWRLRALAIAPPARGTCRTDGGLIDLIASRHWLQIPVMHDRSPCLPACGADRKDIWSRMSDMLSISDAGVRRAHLSVCAVTACHHLRHACEALCQRALSVTEGENASLLATQSRLLAFQ